MPRDATATRERLLDAGTRLFARRGIHAVTIRELTDAAGQRNASALHYHFGSREGLLRAILERHQEAIDGARGKLLARARGRRAIAEALVVPLAGALTTRAGRDYLQIVAQVVGELGLRDALVTEPPNARRAVEAMAATLSDLPDDVRRARIAHVVLLVTHALAHRARLVDARRAVLDHDAFVAELLTTVTGALAARDREGR